MTLIYVTHRINIHNNKYPANVIISVLVKSHTSMILVINVLFLIDLPKEIVLQSADQQHIMCLFTTRQQSCGKEGNVFTGVSLSFCSGRSPYMWPLPMMPWTSLYSHRNPTLDNRPGNPLPSDIRPGSPCYWHLVANTGDLFKIIYLRTPRSEIWWYAFYLNTFLFFNHFSFIPYCFFPFHSNLDIIIGDFSYQLTSLWTLLKYSI